MQVTADASPQPGLVHGTLIANRYRLASVIGRGGTATVWRAHDERLGRDVALKISRRPLAHVPLPNGEERFSGALTHPNVVSIFDAGEIEPPSPVGSFVVMEYIDGPTALQIAPVHWQQAVDIIVQAADGLAALHDHGIVHCDVKPGNLLIDRRGRVLVADLGIATEIDGEIGEYVHGSPAYLAPERLRGECASPRVDVYGLGGVLAHLITGKRPDDGPVTLPLNCPAPLAEVIGRSRSQAAADRYADAHEFREAVLAAAARATDGEDRVVREEVARGTNRRERTGVSRQIISHPSRARLPVQVQSAQETAALTASPVRIIQPARITDSETQRRTRATAIVAASVVFLLLILVVVGIIVGQALSDDSVVAGPAVTLISHPALR